MVVDDGRKLWVDAGSAMHPLHMHIGYTCLPKHCAVSFKPAFRIPAVHSNSVQAKPSSVISKHRMFPMNGRAYTDRVRSGPGIPAWPNEES